MIVRILGEGQLELDEEATIRLDKLDDDLEHAIAANDPAWFDRALRTVLTEVRASGRPVDPTTIIPSDLALPGEGSSLQEVRELLESDHPES
jgi:hypothetical protein